MVLHIKDPGSAITHFIGMLLSFFAGIVLLMKVSGEGNHLYGVAMGVFALSAVLLYMASTVYHTFDCSEKINKLLKKLDHSMIFILIAGSYTPICLLALGDRVGWMMCAVVWGMALIGIAFKLLWVTCPKWLSSVIYIGMGWICVFAFSRIVDALSAAAFFWLLAGGIVYTVGGVIYALRMPLFNAKHKDSGSHEIFHLFVMGGSLCHFIAMFLL